MTRILAEYTDAGAEGYHVIVYEPDTPDEAQVFTVQVFRQGREVVATPDGDVLRGPKGLLVETNTLRARGTTLGTREPAVFVTTAVAQARTRDPRPPGLGGAGRGG